MRHIPDTPPETHSADGQTRIEKEAPGRWIIVLDGRVLLESYETREKARRKILQMKAKRRASA